MTGIGTPDARRDAIMFEAVITGEYARAAGESLARTVLSPLESLEHTRRLRSAELLSVWLECGGFTGAPPAISAMPRQTRNDALARLRVMFGSALTDGDQRFELMLALRRMLPVWRAEPPPPRPRRRGPRPQSVPARRGLTG